VALDLEQDAFSLEASSEPAQRSVRGDDTMTRHYHRQWITPDGLPDGARRAPQRAREVSVGREFSEPDPREALEHGTPEGADPGEVQGDREGPPPAGEELVELPAHGRARALCVSGYGRHSE
jgi:hypothetical protein